MPSLRDLQLRLAESLRDPRNHGVELYVKPGCLSAARRLRIYRNNHYANLTEALRCRYPVVLRLVGARCFESVARAHVAAYPSRSGDLQTYGGELDALLRELPAVRALAYLPDVARLEWAWHEVYHEREHGAWDRDELARVPVDRYGELRFQLQPASRLLASPYPLLRIWQVNQPDYSGDERIDLAEGGVRLLVIRRGLEVEVESLSPGEHALLVALAEANTISEACERALNVEPGFELSRALRYHTARHTLAGIV
ncbi:MAG: DNA-binding domain-containing protein [Gammaproteobacteria bacterium]